MKQTFVRKCNGNPTIDHSQISHEHSYSNRNRWMEVVGFPLVFYGSNWVVVSRSDLSRKYQLQALSDPFYIGSKDDDPNDTPIRVVITAP